MHYAPTGKMGFVPSGYLRTIAAMLSEQGIDFTAECGRRHFSFADYLDSPLGLPREQLESLERFFVSLTPNRIDLWLELGCRLRLPSYGAIGLAYLTAPSVAHMMELCDEFEGLACSLGSQRRATCDGREGLLLDMSQVPADLREFTLVRDLGTSIACLGDAWTTRFPARTMVIGREFDRLLPFATRFGIAIERGEDETALIWDPELSTRPLFNGDRNLHHYYTSQCRKLRARRPLQKPFLDRIGEAIETVLEDGPSQLSLERVARLMRLSVRTLQRRLAEHGTSFRAACDVTRRRLAEDMLRDASTPISDVAFRLGYAEPASFHHAFRRWNGHSPRAYRHVVQPYSTPS